MSRTPAQRFRILVLPLAAAAIAALVVWRMQIDARLPREGDVAERTAMMAAPRSILTDQHRHMAKLEAYLGRTRLIVVFFDGTKPAHVDPIVARLIADFERLEAQGVQPIAISAASPFAVKKSEELAGRKFPFPILMDVDPNGHTTYPAHRAWGLIDNDSETLRQGMFLVDRAGNVSARGVWPLAVKSPDAVIDAILRGEWPDTVQPVRSSETVTPPHFLPGPG